MEPIVACISILVILLTFSVGYLERRSSDRRRRTFWFLRAVIEDQGSIHEANLVFATWIREDRAFVDDNVELEEYKTIVTLLDFYDLISDAANRGVIDREMIISQLGGRMRSAYKMLRLYIEARRTQLERPGLYTPFEKFVTTRIEGKNV